jgi:hypothetical protein
MFALLTSRQTDQPRNDPARVLVGPPNGVVDHLAQTMEHIIQHHFRGRTLLVTRCHPKTTEEELAWEPAARQRRHPTDARPPILDAYDDGETHGIAESISYEELTTQMMVADFSCCGNDSACLCSTPPTSK